MTIFPTGTATFTNGSKSVTSVSLSSGTLAFFDKGTQVKVESDPVLDIVEAIKAINADSFSLAENWPHATGTYNFYATMTAEGINSAVQALRTSSEQLDEANAIIAAVGSIYPSVADGLADTINGDYFSVSGNDPDIFSILYRNDSGSATEISRLSSAEAIADTAQAAIDARTAADEAEADLATFQGQYDQFVIDYGTFSTDFSTFETDYAQFVTDFGTFSTDYAQFVVDYGDFVTNYGQFQTDYAQFVIDYGTFSTDFSTFETDYAQFVNDYSDFTTNYAQFVTDFGTFSTNYSQFDTDYNDFVTVQLPLAEQYRDQALAYRDTAASYANFVGHWSNLTGALNVPAAVEHNGVIWQLLVDLADVTASEPSVSNTDWLSLTSASTTDDLPEGSTNLYFTDVRAVSAIQADPSWNATDWDAAYSVTQSLTAVATSGSYNDLSDKPFIIPEAPTDGEQYVRKDGAWEAVNVESAGATVNKPSITQPTEGETDFLGDIIGSAYITDARFFGTHSRSEWQVARDTAFTDIVDEVNSTTDLTQWTPELGGNPLDTLYVHVRYGSDNHWSEWSDIISFVTPNVFVDAPTLTVEGSPSDVPESPELSTSAFSVTNGTDTHESTDWQVVRTSDSSVVWESLADTGNLLSITVPNGILATSTEYRFRARHRGATYGASDWTEVTYTTTVTFFDFGAGGQTLLAGDMTNGYFGEVTSAELFSGDELATDVGLTAGTSQHSTGGWLKFARNGEIIYIAKKPFRHSISWDDIYAAGLVYGTDDNGLAPTGTPTNQLTTVSKDGRNYICRLMTGAYDDPFTETGRNGVDLSSSSSCQGEYGLGSEWNDLMYKVHQDSPSCPNGETYDGGEQIGSNWDSLTDADIIVASGSGRRFWCQEQSSTNTSRRCHRGTGRLSYLGRYTSSSSNSGHGWRPVLVLQQP